MHPPFLQNRTFIPSTPTQLQFHSRSMHNLRSHHHHQNKRKSSLPLSSVHLISIGDGVVERATMFTLRDFLREKHSQSTGSLLSSAAQHNNMAGTPPQTRATHTTSYYGKSIKFINNPDIQHIIVQWQELGNYLNGILAANSDCDYYTEILGRNTEDLRAKIRYLARVPLR